MMMEWGGVASDKVRGGESQGLSWLSQVFAVLLAILVLFIFLELTLAEHFYVKQWRLCGKACQMGRVCVFFRETNKIVIFLCFSPLSALLDFHAFSAFPEI